MVSKIIKHCQYSFKWAPQVPGINFNPYLEGSENCADHPLEQSDNYSQQQKNLYLIRNEYMCLCKLATAVKGDSKAPFSIVTTPRFRGGSYPRLLHFTLDMYLKMLSVKQRGIKYHFLSLWYDSTWDWTSISWTIGKPSTHLANLCYQQSFHVQN